MDKLTYLAVFEKTEDGGYSVYFPDLPGCIGCGDNYNAAYEDAKEALELHICGMEEDGEKLPIPTKNVIIDPDTAKGYVVSPISIYQTLQKTLNDMYLSSHNDNL